MPRRPPEREVVPVVQRLRIRYAKRGPLRFSSHRDFQRALERALRRAEIPMAYSAGFSPHPKVSYANAAPTGAASEAEYVEIAVVHRCDPQAVARELDAALPPGLDVVEVVEARTPDLVTRLEASRWRIEVPEADPRVLAQAWAEVLAAGTVMVQRLMKSGPRTLDLRPALVSGCVPSMPAGPWVALEATVANVTPTVRPQEILVALAELGGLPAHQPARSTRLAQGPLVDGAVGDPLDADRRAAATP